MPETGVQHVGQFSIIPPARFSFPYNSNNNNTFYTNDAAVRQRRFVYPTATSLDSLAPAPPPSSTRRLLLQHRLRLVHTTGVL